MALEFSEEEKKLLEEIGNLFRITISKPDEDWYKMLSDNERAEVQPILDEIGEIGRRYLVEHLPYSKEEADKYLQESREGIEKKIASIKDEKLRENVKNYFKEIVKNLKRE